MSMYTVKRVETPDWTKIEAVELVHQPWLAPCDIAAKAQACHDGENLYIRMEAEEKDILATLTGPLDQVCNDSCLEFFFAPKSFETEKGWGIEYRVPASYIQMYMPEFRFEGEAACNFYKCGDETETVHYLAWANLTSEKPDYHRRQDFGKLIFEE